LCLFPTSVGANFHRILSRQFGHNTGPLLCCQAQTLPVFNAVQGAQRNLDLPFVVQHARVERLDELLKRVLLPIAGE
jgi:hypothetical protein